MQISVHTIGKLKLMDYIQQVITDLEGGMEGKKERKSQQMSTNLDQNLVSP